MNEEGERLRRRRIRDPATKARIGRGGGETAGKAGKGILPHNWQGRGGSCSNLEDA